MTPDRINAALLKFSSLTDQKLEEARREGHKLVETANMHIHRRIVERIIGECDWESEDRRYAQDLVRQDRQDAQDRREENPRRGPSQP